MGALGNYPLFPPTPISVGLVVVCLVTSISFVSGSAPSLQGEEPEN